MLKTYRIIPLVFILFLFGFTLITVSPVFAQTLDQLIERVEKLEAAVFHEGQTASPGLESANTPEVICQWGYMGDGRFKRSIPCGTCKRYGGRKNCGYFEEGIEPTRDDWRGRCARKTGANRCEEIGMQ